MEPTLTHTASSMTNGPELIESSCFMDTMSLADKVVVVMAKKSMKQSIDLFVYSALGKKYDDILTNC